MKDLVIRVAVSLVVAAAWLFSGIADAGILDDMDMLKGGRSMRSTSTYKVNAEGKQDFNGEPADNNWDNSNVAPGKSRIVLEAEGPGVVTHIWFTFLGPGPNSANHQEMLLKVFYDGSERPGVEVPLGDFFANCFGERREVVSLPVIVEDADSYNCYWRMPWKKSIRIEVENQGDQPIRALYYNIDWVKLKKLPRHTPYFYAQYRQEYPSIEEKDYTVLDTEGQGYYVGTVLAVRTRSPSWFGEGDEKIYIDGEKNASIWGTGTEDYFLSAWGLKTTSTPYFGVPLFDQWGIVGGHTSAYRWHINDPIMFNKRIRVTLEHRGWISPDEKPEGDQDGFTQREDDYASVAYWYQTGTPTFSLRAPHARARKLADLDRTHYASDAAGSARHGQGSLASQRLYLYGRQGQLIYTPPSQEDAWVEIPFEVEKKEPRRLLLKMTRASDYGVYQAYLNGVKLGGPMDFYTDGIDTREFHLLDFWPDPGKYTLRLECTGKDPRSTGHYLGIESVRLRERRPRVTEFAREKDNDWKTDPKLYN